MDFEYFRQALQHISPINDEAWEDFSTLLKPVKLARNAYLVEAGDRTQDCYALLGGVVRVFFNNGGQEYNKTFFIPGMFPTPLTALLSDAPAALSFQCLTDCSLIQFSYKGFRSLFNKHRCLEQLLLAILEQEWISKERHDIRMVTLDATANYLLFRETYPGLEQLIPQYHIASYLGITPIQLSRIRAQLAKNH